MALIDQARKETLEAQKKLQQEKQIEIFNRECLDSKIAKHRFEQFKKAFTKQVLNEVKNRSIYN